MAAARETKSDASEINFKDIAKYHGDGKLNVEATLGEIVKQTVNRRKVNFMEDYITGNLTVTFSPPRTFKISSDNPTDNFTQLCKIISCAINESQHVIVNGGSLFDTYFILPFIREFKNALEGQHPYEYLVLASSSSQDDKDYALSGIKKAKSQARTRDAINRAAEKSGLFQLAKACQMDDLVKICYWLARINFGFHADHYDRHWATIFAIKLITPENSAAKELFKLLRSYFDLCGQIVPIHVSEAKTVPAVLSHCQTLYERALLQKNGNKQRMEDNLRNHNKIQITNLLQNYNKLKQLLYCDSILEEFRDPFISALLILLQENVFNKDDFLLASSSPAPSNSIDGLIRLEHPQILNALLDCMIKNKLELNTINFDNVARLFNIGRFSSCSSKTVKYTIEALLKAGYVFPYPSPELTYRDEVYDILNCKYVTGLLPLLPDCLPEPINAFIASYAVDQKSVDKVRKVVTIPLSRFDFAKKTLITSYEGDLENLGKLVKAGKDQAFDYLKAISNFLMTASNDLQWYLITPLKPHTSSMVTPAESKERADCGDFITEFNRISDALHAMTTSDAPKDDLTVTHETTKLLSELMSHKNYNQHCPDFIKERIEALNKKLMKKIPVAAVNPLSLG